MEGKKKLVEIFNSCGFRGDFHDFGCRLKGPIVYFGTAAAYIDNPLFIYIESYFTSCYTKPDLPLYRFLSAERTIYSLENRVLSASNLVAQSENDSEEVSEFYNNVRVVNPSGGIGFLDDKDHKIKDLKNNYFVLCFTKSANQRFWQEYGQNKGCRLEFKIKGKPCPFVRYAEILYEPTELYEKIKEVQTKVIVEFNKPLFLSGITHYPLVCKRKSYDWEDEVRYIFHSSQSDFPIKEPLENVFNIDIPIGKYCKKPDIRLDLRDIKFGKDIDNSMKNRIQGLFDEFKGANSS